MLKLDIGSVDKENLFFIFAVEMYPKLCDCLCCRISLQNQGSGPKLDVTQLKDRGPVHIAPGQTMPVVVSFQEVEPGEKKECTDAV